MRARTGNVHHVGITVMGTVLEATGYGKADLRSTRLLGQREDCATPSSDQFPLNFWNHSLMI
jgi:hypothetical protein